MEKEKKWRTKNQRENIENQEKKQLQKQCKEHKKTVPQKRKKTNENRLPSNATTPGLRRTALKARHEHLSLPNFYRAYKNKLHISKKNAQIVEVIAREINREETKFKCQKNNKSAKQM